ncbi:MAG: flippase-like domain-containing protein [Myxococcales bacterium]|nr:flippase-like domain-containing protein [Myxococcales bacterium]
MLLGLFITVVAIWFAFRDVDVRAVLGQFRRANLVVLLGLSIPAYLLMVYLRALRWRHLIDPTQSVPTGALFRAVAVGFMANNVFPLRMGEFVRSWYLGRETGVSPTAIFGTVILERVVDTLVVILLALAVLLIWGGGDDGAWRRGLLLLVPVALAPIAGLTWLRRDAERVLGLVSVALRPLPARLRGAVVGQLRTFSGGLGALRGGVHLFWIAFHSLLIWLVASSIPISAGILALGVDLGTPARMLAASWTTLAAVGIAVALPSAPGFFGVYHSACRLALERFGIPAEVALALGTLVHAVFWFTLTGLGFGVLRSRVTSLAEVDEIASR